MKQTTGILLFVLTAVFSSGCAWVKVSEEGKNVAILPASRVMDCNRIGKVTTSVKDSVIGLNRKQHIIQNELDGLAREQAVKMNANSLVRVSTQEGTGTYIAYRCP